MAHSGRQRHRDKDPGQRRLDQAEPPPVDRVFRMTDAERQEIASCLRDIDVAGAALERQQRSENRPILRELKACADRIYDVIAGLELDGN